MRRQRAVFLCSGAAVGVALCSGVGVAAGVGVAVGVATESTAKGVECSDAEGEAEGEASFLEQSSYSSHVPLAVSLNSKPTHQALCLLSALLHECSQSALVALRPALPLPSSCSANQWSKSWSATRRQREMLPLAAAAAGAAAAEAAWAEAIAAASETTAAAACLDAGGWAAAAACWEAQSS